METASSMEEPHFNIRLSRTMRRQVSHPIIVKGMESFAEESYFSLDGEAVEVLQRYIRNTSLESFQTYP
ncbi:MAG: hypothetical protein N3F10_05590 [Candidatus Bathyarchaeota archaeon]|nr:hypothetical protein [Candidatus Bathyarchaeota archaeon]